MKLIAHVSCLTFLVATMSGTSHATMYALSGPIDALQAGTNGGFGSVDGTVTGAGDGLGLISGDYDDVTNMLNYGVSWQDLTGAVTNMHFHIGAPSVQGGVDLAVPGPWASPQMGSGVMLSAGAESNLLNGDWYLNIHTGSFPGGEIRGQVIVTPVPEPIGAGLIGWMAFAAFATVRRIR